MAFKLNGQTDFTSNIDAFVNQITSKLKKIPSVNFNVNSNGLSNAQKSLERLAAGTKISVGTMKELQKATKGVESEMEIFGRTTGNTIKRFSAFIGVVQTFNLIKDAIRSSFTESVAFEKEMLKISQTTGLAIQDLGGLNQQISDLSKNLGVSSKELTKVALVLSQAGLSARDTQKALEIIAKTDLSATFDNMNATAEGSIALLSQFKLKVEDLAGTLNSISKVSAKFAVESADLITAIRKTGGAFSAVGGSVNELLGLMTSVRSATRESADSIATGLRTIFTRLERPKTLDYLKELGINLRNSDGEFIGVYESVRKLNKELSNVSGTDPRFISILEEIGGYRQIDRSIALIREFNVAQKAYYTAQRANNTIDKEVEIAKTGLANRLARVTEEFNQLIRTISNDVFIRGAIDRFLDLASALIKVGDAIRPLVPVFAALGIGSVIKGYSPFITGVAKSFTPPIKRARGGIVPGTGSGDTVPAMLEPGEFIIRKSAVQAFGADNLAGINKFAGGGIIRNLQKRSAYRGDRKVLNAALTEFQAKTGINPSGIIDSVRLRYSGSAGGFNSETRGLEINPQDIRDKNKAINRLIKKQGFSLTPKESIRSVIFHELGHALDIPSSSGVPTSTINPNSRNATLARIYGKIHDTTTYRKALGNVDKEYLDYLRKPYEEFANLTSDVLTGRFKKDYRGYAKRVGYSSGTAKEGYNTIKSSLGKTFAEQALVSDDVAEFKSLIGSGLGNRAKYRKFAGGGFVRSIGRGLGRVKGGVDNLLIKLLGEDNLSGRGAKPNPFFSWTTPEGDIVSPFDFLQRSQKTRKLSSRESFLPISPDFSSLHGNSLTGKNVIVNRKGFSFSDVKRSVMSGRKYGTDPQVNSIFPERVLYAKSYQRNSSDFLTKDVVEKELGELQKILGIDISKLVNTKIIIGNIGNRKNADGSFRQVPAIYNTKKGIGLNPSIIKNQESLRAALSHEIGHAVDNYIGGSGFRSRQLESTKDKGLFSKLIKHRLDRHNKLYSGKNKDHYSTPQEQIAELFRDIATGKIGRGQISLQSHVRQLYKALESVGLTLPIKRSDGGGIPGSGNHDTVPALLTPGEFVINKKSAQAFGYGNLRKINKYAKGGTVKRYAAGDKVTGGGLAAGLGAAFIVPQLAQAGTDALGLGTSLPQFSSALTLATTALIVFGSVAKKDVSAIQESIKSKEIENHNNEKAIGEFRKTQKEARQQDLKTQTAQVEGRLPQELKEIGEQRAKAEKVKAGILKGHAAATVQGKGIAPSSYQALRNINDELSDLDTRAKHTIQTYKTGGQDRRDEINAQHRANVMTSTLKNQPELNSYIEASKKTSKELEQLKKQEIRANRTNKLVTGLSIAGGIGLGLSGLLSDNVASSVASGNKRTNVLGMDVDTGTASGLGGFLSGASAGAFTGAAIGSYIPVPGATLALGALGGLAGGVLGGKSSYSEANSKLNITDFNKGVDRFSKQLQNVLIGKSDIKTQKGGLDSYLKSVSKDFFKLQGNEFKNLESHMTGLIDGLDAYLDKVIELGGSTEDIIKKNEDLVLSLSRFGNQSVPDVEKRIREGVEKRNKSVANDKEFLKLQDENAKRLRAIYSTLGAVGDATRSVHDFGLMVEQLDQFANGITSINSKYDFSALDNPANSDISQLTNQVNRASGFIGGSSGVIGQEVINSAKLLQNLPTILNQIVNSKQLDTGKRDIAVELEQQLGGGFAANLIRGKFREIIGATGDSNEFLKNFRRDPTAVINELQSAVGPIIDVFKEAVPQIIQQFDEFSNGLARGRENFIRSLDGLVKIIDLEDFNNSIDAGFTGRTRTFAEKQAFDERRIETFSGGANVQELGKRLTQAQNEIANLSQQRQQATDSKTFKELELKIDEQVREENQVRKALEMVADGSARLANIQEELARLERTRTNKTNLAKGFLFGDASAKREIIKGLFGQSLIEKNIKEGKLPLEGLSQGLKEAALQVMETFGQDRLFNGETGDERIRTIVGKSLRFNPNQLNPEEQAAKQTKDDLFARTKEAQDILNKNLTDRNNDFLVGLGAKFDNFFTRLEHNFTNKEAEFKAKEADDKKLKSDRIDESVKRLLGISKEGNIPLNTNEQRNRLEQNLPDLLQLKSLNEQNALFEKSKKGGFTEREVRESFGNKAAEIEKEAAKFGPQTLDNKQRQDFLLAEAEKIQKNNSELANELLGGLQQNLIGANIAQLVESAEKIQQIIKDIEPILGVNELNAQKAAVGKANGGMIWGKRGSDTVPAMTPDGQPYMLTPGEMVMNRRAVGKYGPTLRMMNYRASGGDVYNGFYGKRPVDGIDLMQNFAKNIEEHRVKKFNQERQKVQAQLLSIKDPLLERAKEQTRRNKADIKASQIRRGVDPNSPAASYPYGTNFDYVDYNFKNKGNPLAPRGKFGGYDPNRTKVPNQNIQRARGEEEAIAYNKAYNKKYAELRKQKVGVSEAQRQAKEYGNEYANKYKSSSEYLYKGNKRHSSLLNDSTQTDKFFQESNRRRSIDRDRADYQHNSPRAVAIRQRREELRLAEAAKNSSPLNSPGMILQNQQNKPVNQSNPVNQVTNPKIMEDVNKIVEKINGTKMELVLSGTLNVNITEGALSDKVKEHFKTAVTAYVDEKIIKAVNQLISDANLAVLPKPEGQKQGNK
jgi:TP901 family phage tail tape measure protein